MVLGSFACLLISCKTPPEKAPQPPDLPLLVQEDPTSLPSIEASPIQPPRSFRSVYHITTDPPEVGVYRELGELVGITPITLEFQYERITRLTFLKKGYLIQSRIIEPKDGEHRLHVVLIRE